MLWLLAAVVLVLTIPAILALAVRGEPDNAIRHESGEPDETWVKQR